MERRKKVRRKVPRRRLLSEKEFRRLIETGKVTKEDRRLWKEQRRKPRRKVQYGV